MVVVVMRKITANNNNNTDNLRSIDVEPGMYGWYGMVNISLYHNIRSKGTSQRAPGLVDGQTDVGSTLSL